MRREWWRGKSLQVCFLFKEGCWSEPGGSLVKRGHNKVINVVSINVVLPRDPDMAGAPGNSEPGVITRQRAIHELVRKNGARLRRVDGSI